MEVFRHHIYEFQKGLRSLILHTAPASDVPEIVRTLEAHGIAYKLSYLSNGHVNVFFGNALDNAAEYLSTVDEEKRFIRISSTRNNSLLLVRIENYCETDVQFGKDGLPRSSKSGSNSYGTHSIRAVAEKYGGNASFSLEGNLFVVTALFSASEAY